VISQFEKRFWKCSAGTVAAMTALVLPLLLGATSLGVEVGHWYLGVRQMQGAADAAAISAAAQYIADYPTNPVSLTYQTVGVNYALTNGYAIPTTNVCLVPLAGADNCGTVRALDARPIVCSAGPCVVVEITQNTANWLTTKLSLEPRAVGHMVQAIPTPTLKVRAIVRAVSQTVSTTTAGTDCILALANDPSAVRVHGNGDLEANCGVAIDGGRDQNANGPALGGITFNGAPAKVNISNLVVASSSTGCPSAHCFLYNPATSALPAADIKMNTATPDPYAAQVAALFAIRPPAGVQTGGVAINTAGSGYVVTSTGKPNGTCTLTVTGSSYYVATTSSPATFTATISGGKVTAIGAVTDPGAYATFPTSPVAVTSTNCSGSGATFTLTEGCFTWVTPPAGASAISGRKYCSINLLGAGTTNFSAGSYWIAGGDSGCVGFCVSSNNATVTSDAAGVTFLLTNGDGANSRGTTSYATVAITSGTVSLCAPGTSTGKTCTNTNFGSGCTATTATSCLLFVQNPAATTSTVSGLANPATTNTFDGNGTRTLSGLIYLPKQTFAEAGNGPIQGCTGIIAKYFDIGGTPLFNNGCLPGNGIGGTTTTVTTWGTPFLYQ
jgi:Flp pilus assembly protein TadG